MAETRPNPELLLNLEKYIQNARDAQGLTQEKVGEVIGRAGKSVSNIECGRTNPKYDTLYAIFRALNVDVNGLSMAGIQILRNSAESATSWDILFAATTLSILPTLLVFAFFNKLMVDGVTSGSVKG